MDAIPAQACEALAVLSDRLNTDPATKIITYGTAGYVALAIVGKIYRRYVLLPKFTLVDDLPNLGKPRKDGRKLKGTAVIAGGGLSGLLAAAVCADHFEDVIIIEPEAYANSQVEIPETTTTREGKNGIQVPITHRTRVMQWFSVHAYLPPVYSTMKGLFPNLKHELDYLGLAPVVMNLRGEKFIEPFSHIDESLPIPPGVPMSVSACRESYETLVRRCVKVSRRNVKFVTGLVTGVRRAKSDGKRDERDGDAVDGVQVKTDNGDVTLDAALIVDATGTSQAAYHKWLPRAGFFSHSYESSAPRITRDAYTPHTKLSTGTYFIPEHLRETIPIPWGFRPGILWVFLAAPILGEDRQSVAGVIDGNRIQIGTYCKDYHPRPHSIAEIRVMFLDLKGRDERIHPWIWKFLDFMEEHEQELQPHYSDIGCGTLGWVKYHEPHNGAVVPRNFVAVGDSWMLTNSAGGLGCTKLSFDAVGLDRCLRTVPSHLPLPGDFSKKYFKLETERCGGMWQNTKGLDYGWDDTTPVKGEALSEGHFARKLRSWVIDLCSKDTYAAFSFWWIATYQAPPTDMFAPRFLLKILFQAVFGRKPATD